MPTIVGVRLRNPARPVRFDTAGAELQEGDLVVVTTERGQELGRVAVGPEELSQVPSSVRSIDRIATEEDLRLAEDAHAREKEAMPVFRRLISKHKLDMKPVDVEVMLDASKVIFYFAAEERVDFRDLVRDLASEFHARIDMRQIGVRDEARMIGGLGHCGEQLCCERFGGEFQPVSIRMAKEQDLPLNPLKISGVCGRLMCCLRYEYDAYKDFKSRAPKRNAIIEVGESLGKVIDLNTPKETVTMRLQEGGTLTVPLAEMTCSCEKGCPCKVTAEVADKASGRAAAAALADIVSLKQAEPLPAEHTTAPEPAPGEQAGTRRKRRRRSGGAQGSQAAGNEQKAGDGAQGGSKAPASGATAGGKSSRGGSSRRRRSSGGSKTGTPAPAADAQPRPASASGGEGGTASAPPSGRRRRRRRGSGGGGTTPPAE